jgi:predicted HicB family RNase H-like nuclease
MNGAVQHCQKEIIMDQKLTKNMNLNVRIPPDIHRAVKQRAVRARRSLNGEISTGLNSR